MAVTHFPYSAPSPFVRMSPTSTAAIYKAPFSSSAARPTSEPGPKLSAMERFKILVPSPRLRAVIYVSLGIASAVEGYGWYTFGPKILGRDKKAEGSE